MRLIRLFTLTLNFSHRGFYRFLWPDYWAEVLRPGVMRGDSILWSSSSTEPRTPKQTPCFLCSLGQAVEPGPRQWRHQPSSVAATRESDTRGQSSHQMLASHWSPGAVLASDWLMGWHQSPWVPDPRWEEIGQRWDAARDNKISPSGRECNAQYTVQCLYCSPLGNIPWLLQIFMASLNTNTMCYNQLYLLWWLMGPNAKWSGAGGRGLTLYTVWSPVTGWIEVMNFKTCLNLLQISLFLYLQTLVFLPCTTSSPSWEVSLRIVSKVHWKVLRSF